jgi:hypothetical protein
VDGSSTDTPWGLSYCRPNNNATQESIATPRDMWLKWHYFGTELKWLAGKYWWPHI